MHHLSLKLQLYTYYQFEVILPNAIFKAYANMYWFELT